MDDVNKTSGGVQSGNGSEIIVQREQDAVSSRQREYDEVRSTDLLEQLNTNWSDRLPHHRKAKAFSQKSRLIRADLLSLESFVDAYSNLKALDSSIVAAYTEFLHCCGLSEQQLDEQQHEWCPSKVYKLFEDFDHVRQAAENKFREVYRDKQFQDRREIQILQQFFDANAGKSRSDSSSSSSVGTKRANILKLKVPKSRQLIEDEYHKLNEEFTNNSLNNIQPGVLLKKCEYLERHVAEFGTRLEEYSNVSEITVD